METETDIQTGERTHIEISITAGNRARIADARSAQPKGEEVVFLGSDPCGYRFCIFGCEFTIPFIGLTLSSWGGEKWPHDLPEFFESNGEGRSTRLTDYGAAHCNRVFQQARK